jgi:hypothetical protein
MAALPAVAHEIEGTCAWIPGRLVGRDMVGFFGDVPKQAGTAVPADLPVEQPAKFEL